MFDQENLPLTFLNNPLSIQKTVLDELQNRLLNEGETIEDANNVFCFLLESASSMTADAVNGMIDTFPSLYPRRAQTSLDLYKHMSTWDYLNLFSTPSSVILSMFMDKDYLIKNAVSFNDNYKKVVIPKETVFKVAQYTFGIHYPIEIRINKLTNTFIVAHDTTTDNPLQSLKQNTIEYKLGQYGGMNFIAIAIPVYQFVKTEYIEDVSPNIGFSKSYTHEDLFFATRIYNQQNGEWIEMAQTLSDEVYDPRIATAKLKVAQDVSKVQITIPQVYFTNGDIGERIKIEMYTTKGEVDADISGISVDALSANFKLTGDAELDKYSVVLDHIPTLGLSPSSSKITGGNNGYGFEELAPRVINDTFYGEVLITPGDLEKYFEDLNFIVIRYRDGITHRIYHCFKELTDRDGVIIGASDIQMQITSKHWETAPKDDDYYCSTIKRNPDESVTILPTTLFKYSTATNLSYPVSDQDIAAITGGLNSLTKPQLVSEFNNNIYVINPFHIRLETDGQYPIAISYDLMKPTIDRIEFIKENVKVSTQMTIFNAIVRHVLPEFGEDLGRYEIEFVIEKSDDLKDVDPSHLAVLIKTKSFTKVDIWTQADYAYYNLIGTTVSGSDELLLTETELENISTGMSITGPGIPVDTIISEINGAIVKLSNAATSDNSEATYTAHRTDKYRLTIKTNYAISTEHTFTTKDSFEDAASQLIHDLELLTDFEFIFLVHEDEIPTPGARATAVGGTIPASLSDFIPVAEQLVRVNFGRRITEVSNDVDVRFTGLGYACYPNDEYAIYPFDVFERDVDGVPNYTIVPNPTPPPDNLLYLITLNHQGEWIYQNTIGDFNGDTVLDSEILINVGVTHLTDWDLLQAGMGITGPGIPQTNPPSQQGTFIISWTVESSEGAGDGTITLSNLATVSDTGKDFIIGNVLVIHAEGDPILDAEGEPTPNEDTERSTYYNVKAIQLDAKLNRSEAVEHEEYIPYISDQLRTYFDAVNTAVDQMIENTKLYFKPLRTIGNAVYKLGNSVVDEFPLELTMKLKIFVEEHVMENAELKEVIRVSSLKIIDDYIHKGQISCTAIANKIKDEMSDNVKYVDVLGINGNTQLQTLITLDSNTRPSLKMELVLDEEDNTIGVERGLDITFVSV